MMDQLKANPGYTQLQFKRAYLKRFPNSLI